MSALSRHCKDHQQALSVARLFACTRGRHWCDGASFRHLPCCFCALVLPIRVHEFAKFGMQANLERDSCCLTGGEAVVFRRYVDENIPLYTYDVTMRHAKRLRGFGPAEHSILESETKPVIITANIITPRRLQQYHRKAQ